MEPQDGKGNSQDDRATQRASIPEKGKWVHQGGIKKGGGEKWYMFLNEIVLVESHKVWVGTKEINNNKGDY